ncbi:hypothetical protein LBMAG42_51180 [Deltaproteobacteria bacterium]|nr:hypothetical protein LBMAG42_51180 [Deltaproteobacteria bacterium]
MSARTRLVYFIIDPYSDSRTPVAAILNDGTVTTMVRVRLPPLVPSADAAVARALADIESHPDFDALPIGAGPYFLLGDSRTLPAGVVDPGRWVLDYALRAA